jgi:hypothetical protein
MKSQFIRNISVALLAAASVFAQGSQRLTVQVPFGFHVGASVLPAGDYTVDKATPAVLRIRSDDSKASAMILTNSVQKLDAPSQGKLIFNRYGDEYFLCQVWAPGNNIGSELRKTKREVEAASAVRRSSEIIVARK